MKLISNWPWTGRLIMPREDFRPVRWGFGFEAAGQPIHGVAFALGPEVVGQDVRLRIWHRPKDSVNSPFDPEIFSAPALHDRVQAIDKATLVGPIAQFHWFALSELVCTDGLYICELTMPSGVAEQPFGVGIADFDPPWDWQAGWFMTEGGKPRPAKLPVAVAWMLGTSSAGPTGTATASPKITADAVDPAGDCFHLRFPPIQVDREGWVMHLPGASLAVPQPRSHAAAVTMPPGVDEVRLPFRFAELLEAPAGVELRSNPTRLVRSGDGAEEAVVTYRGWETRYDAVSIDPRSGRLHFSEGPGRRLDPEEYPASVPPGYTPLFSVYTTFASAEAVRIDGWQDLVRHGCEDRHLYWLEYCRRGLPRTLKRLRTGGDLRLSGYGDSVTSLGGRHGDQMLAPNGPHRDHFGYFELYGEDWKEEQRQRSSSSGGTRHHQLGWNWQLKRTIEQRWPVAVEYLNWGLPGTTTCADEVLTEGGLRMPNGSNRERLERLLADKPDLVVIAFGTNDVGMGIDTRANMVRMIEAICASGSEAIVVGPCPPNPAWGSRDPMLWLQTYDATISAARKCDVAFVPTLEIFGDGREGAIGLSQRSYAAASMGNHPGARELAAVGKFLSAIIP